MNRRTPTTSTMTAQPLRDGASTCVLLYMCVCVCALIVLVSDGVEAHERTMTAPVSGATYARTCQSCATLRRRSSLHDTHQTRRTGAGQGGLGYYMCEGGSTHANHVLPNHGQHLPRLSEVTIRCALECAGGFGVRSHLGWTSVGFVNSYLLRIVGSLVGRDGQLTVCARVCVSWL